MQGNPQAKCVKVKDHCEGWNVGHTMKVRFWGWETVQLAKIPMQAPGPEF